MNRNADNRYQVDASESEVMVTRQTITFFRYKRDALKYAKAIRRRQRKTADINRAPTITDTGQRHGITEHDNTQR